MKPKMKYKTATKACFCIIFGIIFLLSSAFTAPGDRVITGTVIDDTGASIPGASVIIKGTTTGTATDINGKFSLKVPKETTTIVVSYVGMIKQEIKITNKTKFTIKLKTDTKKVDEVVVTGYQTINRHLFTGSATKLKSKDIKLAAVPDASQFLQGNVAGVSVENVSGTFGVAPVVRIRGNASINGNNKPLWVIDGVVVKDLINVSNDDLASGNMNTVLSSGIAGLNPDDIKDIQVLKDVSATALYGAQAMNGVIVITTKNGSKGKLSVNYSGSVAIKERPNVGQFDIANSVEEMSVYKQLIREGWFDAAKAHNAQNAGVLTKMYESISDNKISWGPEGTVNENFLTPYANANTDWFDELFKVSVVNQHSVSLSGGGENATYYASLSYYNDNGRSIADKADKYTGTMKTTFHVSKKFDLGIKLSMSRRIQKLPGSSDASFNSYTGNYSRSFDINPFSYALNTSRSMRPYDENGNLEYFTRDYAPFNILNEYKYNYVDLSTTNLIGQLNLKYDITKDITLKSISQFNRNTALREERISSKANSAQRYRATDPAIVNNNKLLFKDPEFPNALPKTILPSGGFYDPYDNSMNYFSTLTSLAYNHTFNDTHILSFLLGQEIHYTDRKQRGSDGYGIQYDRGNVFAESPLLSKYLNNINQSRAYLANQRNRSVGYFLNGAYSYKGKYTANTTFRRDGSNQLGSTNTARYMNSWNVSGKWNMKEENFLKNVDWINMLSPKATYGLNGFMGPSTSAAEILTAYKTSRLYGKETGIGLSQLANNALSWEKMYELNLSLEAAFFRNRIYVDFSYYKRKSFDLIGTVHSSGIGGQTYKNGNFADMKVNGCELTLNTTNIDMGGFKWTSGFTANYNTNKITKLIGSKSLSAYMSSNGANVVGRARKVMYSIHFTGLDNYGLPQFTDASGKPITSNLNIASSEGLNTYLRYEGLTEAPLSGGFNNTFNYKNISLRVGIIFRGGNKIRLNDLYPASPADMILHSVPKTLKNRWISPGDEKKTNIPAIPDKRFSKGLSDNNLNLYTLYNKSDARVADGSFVRLNNITLGYTLPNKIIHKIGLQHAHVSFQVQNVALLYSDSKLNGRDPEFINSGGIAMPTPRTYTFSLNFGF